VLGVHTGSVVHVAAAAFGLSAILASSATAFSVVKYVGAAYLVWLGVRTLLRPDDDGEEDVAPRRSLGRIYAQGVVVNVLNPKTALFFLAFLPQFVDVTRGSAPLQVAVLGLLFMALGLISDSTYALVAARISRRVRSGSRRAVFRRWLPGATYIALGVTSAVAGSRRSAAA
jgi:threonine/homoserine/homoserine lactone efflux protein